MAGQVTKNLIVLGVAIVVGGFAAFGARYYFEAKQQEFERSTSGETLRLVVASEDLPKGQRLTQQNLASRSIPVDWAQSGAVRPEQFEQIRNLRLAHPVRAGEFIMWSMLEDQNAAPFATRVSAGRRAIAVPVDEISSLSGMLQPGDRIDLFVSLQRHQSPLVAPLLQNMLVLAAGDRVTAGAGQPRERTYTSITLDASPEEAALVMLAKDAGKLNAVLRHPDDTAPLPAVPNLKALLMGIEEVRPVRPGIPILVGGQPLSPGSPAAAATPESRSMDRLATALERMALTAPAPAAPAPTSPGGASLPQPH